MNKKNLFTAHITAFISSMLMVGMFIFITFQMLPNSYVQKSITKLSITENAIYTFNRNYNAIPGDIRNATKIWSASDFNDKCSYYEIENKKTKKIKFINGANGNGTGIIEKTIIKNNDLTDQFYKPSAYICHLILSGILLKTIETKANVQNILSETHKGKDSINSGFLISKDTYIELYGSREDTEQLNKGNNLYVIGPDKPSHTVPFYTGNAKLSGIVLSMIDQKIDDGKPGTGKIKMLTNKNTQNKYKYSNCCTETLNNKCTEKSKFTETSSKNSCYMIYELNMLK